MSAVDVSAFIGQYPFRHLPSAGATDLVRAMDGADIARAWVGHLPSAFYQDPRPASHQLLDALGAHRDRLMPVPTVHPGLPLWSRDLQEAIDAGAPAVRVFPQQQGLDAAGGPVGDLAVATAEASLALVLTVRFEDLRQRHPLDTAPDLPPSAVRSLARRHQNVRLLVTHAGREFVEEVHFGLTAAEAARVLWDVSWIWGPPFDDLQRLVRTVGMERFAFGTGFPLRIAEATSAKLELTDLDADARDGIRWLNLERWSRTEPGPS